jgi:hypothetical protein
MLLALVISAITSKQISHLKNSAGDCELFLANQLELLGEFWEAVELRTIGFHT